MQNLINNILLVEKWNGGVEVLPNYLIIVVFPYLEAFQSSRKSMCKFFKHNPFGKMLHKTVADIKF
jgi:hypothetical protein